MNDAIELAQQFLADQIKLEQVKLEDISGGIYKNPKLKDCDIFMFSLFEKVHIGSAQYIAVPKGSSNPFYFGELGE